MPTWWAALASLGMIIPTHMHSMDQKSKSPHIPSKNQEQASIPKLLFSDPVYEEGPHGITILNMYSQLSPRAISPFIHTNADAINVTFIQPQIARYSSRHAESKMHTRLHIDETCLMRKAIEQGNAALITHLIERANVNLTWRNSKGQSLAAIALKECARHFRTKEKQPRTAIVQKIMKHAPLATSELALLVIKAQNKKTKALKNKSLSPLELSQESALFDLLMQTCNLTSLTHLNVKRWTAISAIETPFEKLVGEQKQAIMQSGYKPRENLTEDNPTTLWVGVTKKGIMEAKLSCPLSDAIHNCSFITIENANSRDLHWLNHEGKQLSIHALELAYKSRTDLCSQEFRKARTLMAQHVFKQAPPSSAQWASYLAHLITTRKFDLLAACCKIKPLKDIYHLPFVAYLLIKGNDSSECLNALTQLLKRGACPLARCCYRHNKWLNAFKIAKAREHKIPKLAGLLKELSALQKRTATAEHDGNMFIALNMSTYGT